MKSIGIIPARYASTRLEGKPLVDIAGTSMIERVYRQCLKSNLDKVIVATDDLRIYEAVKAFGGAVAITQQHDNGTARCHEVLQKQLSQYDIMVNIQGDEPFVAPSQINQLLEAFEQKNTSIATLAKKIDQQEDLFNPNIVKVVFGENQNALYFSRSPLPFIRDIDRSQWLQIRPFYKHLGLYAFSSDFLLNIYPTLAPSLLEKSEKLEQLRWLENGIPIRILLTKIETIGIDTPEDLQKALTYLANL